MNICTCTRYARIVFILLMFTLEYNYYVIQSNVVLFCGICLSLAAYISYQIPKKLCSWTSNNFPNYFYWNTPQICFLLSDFICELYIYVLQSGVFHWDQSTLFVFVGFCFCRPSWWGLCFECSLLNLFGFIRSAAEICFVFQWFFVLFPASKMSQQLKMNYE